MKGLGFVVMLFLLGSCVGCVNYVSAVAISGAYTYRNPLEIAPGEEIEFELILQNMAGDGDVKFKAIAEGDFVSLTDSNKEYLVPLGSNNVLVKVSVKIPKETDFGEYNATIKFEPIPLDTGGGMVQIAVGLSRSFKIIVRPAELLEKPVKISWGIVALFLGLIVLLLGIVILFYLSFKRKEKVFEEKII